MGITEKLARLAIETPDEVLTQSTLLESTKLRLLDGLAIMVAGAREESTGIALDLAREWGGAAQASVAGHPDRLPAHAAGFVNGVSAHSQEYDDYTRGAGHITVAMAPGALVVAEAAGASGRDLAAGFVAGFEVVCRVARATNPHIFNRGFHQNTLWGEIGIAATSARINGLDLTQTQMALGIACSGGTGIRRNVGSMGKAYHVGHGVMNGVIAASLARRGFIIDPEAILGDDDAPGHGKFGLLQTYNGKGNYDLSEITDGLGERWELAGDRTAICFHPGSTAPAAAVDCALDLRAEHGIDPKRIRHIALYVTPEALDRACYHMVENCYQARYSMPWSVCVALTDGKAGVAQYTDARIACGDVQALLQKTEVSVPQDLAHHVGPWAGDVNWSEMRMTVTLDDGTVIEGARSHARGWPEDGPASFDDVAAKFSDAAEGVLSDDRRDAVIDMV